MNYTRSIGAAGIFILLAAINGCATQPASRLQDAGRTIQLRPRSMQPLRHTLTWARRGRFA